MTTSLLILLGIIPSFAWLIFFIEEDCHPEPRRLLLYTFLSGILITVLALQIQILVNQYLGEHGIAQYSALSLLILTAIEELAKFFAAFWIIRGRKEFDEPVDAMIYMIVAALGFAAVENVSLVFQSQGALSPGKALVEVATLRFVGATLLHALSSALVGYYWARAAFEIHRSILITIGLVIATVLHASFNYLILNLSSLIWPIILIFFTGIFIFKDFDILKKYESQNGRTQKA